MNNKNSNIYGYIADLGTEIKLLKKENEKIKAENEKLKAKYVRNKCASCKFFYKSAFKFPCNVCILTNSKTKWTAKISIKSEY